MTALLINPKVLTAYAIFQLLALLWAFAAMRSWDKNRYVPQALVVEYFPGWDLAGLNTKYYLSPPGTRDYWRTAFLVLTPGVNLITVGFMMPFYAVVELRHLWKSFLFDREMREMRRYFD